VWAAVLPYTQPSVRVALQVERHLVNGDIETALVLMSNGGRESFPSHWDPPPWPGYDHDTPHLIDVLEQLGDSPSLEWVRDIYVEKLFQRIGRGHAAFAFLAWMEQEEFERYMRVLEQTPETHDLIREHSSALELLMNYRTESNDVRERQIRQLLESVGVELASQQEKPEGVLPTESKAE